jgi:tetratricopeptide (TPR) repeat protein
LEPILNDLLEVDPDSQEYLGTLGMVQGNIAVFLRMLEKHEQAIETLRVSDATLRRYAELIENTPDSLYAIALNQYGLAKSCLSLKSFDEGVFAIQTSMAMTSSLLKDHPDYLLSRMHQVDELIVMCELLEAQPDSDPSELMQTVQTALATSTKLLTDIPEIPEYEVAHGLLYSSLALAHLRLGKVDRAIASANEGIAYLQSLKSDIQLSNVREAYMHNYLTLAKSLGAQWSGLDEGDQQKRAEVLSDFELSLEKSREFGASQDELDKLKLLVGG